MPTAEVLRLDRTYDAPAEAVFDAWTSEAVLRRWFHAGSDWQTSEAFVDLQVGGAVRVVMFDPHEGESHGGGGRYTEVDRRGPGWRFMRNTGTRCAALDTRVHGQFPCGVYERRPEDCRIVEPGSPCCLEARRLGRLGASVEFQRAR